MEALEEASVQYSVESVKSNTLSDEIATPSVEASLCFTSNGVAETTITPLEAAEVGCSHLATDEGGVQEERDGVPIQPANEVFVEVAPGEPVPNSAIAQVVEQEILAAMETNAAVQSLLGEASHSEAITEEVVEPSEAILCNEVTVESCTSMIESIDASNDKFTLRTEVLVEKSEDDINDSKQVIADDHENGHNILNDLGQGIELSEALRSSDTTDHVENNNDSVKEEVFNKEELLDILEGNDSLLPGNEIENNAEKKKMIETEIALKQLSRLQKKRKTPIRGQQRTPRKKKTRKSDTSESENVVESPEKENKDDTINNVEEGEPDQENNCDKTEVKNNDNILHTLVKEWDDDEPVEGDQSNELLEQSEKLLKTTDQLVKSQETAATTSKGTKRKSVECPAVENQNKSGDESQPPRGRQGRVIKKKVPFDPDNPDTFTKSKEKVVAKTKEPQQKEPQVKESQADKEQPTPKKPKQEQTPQRAKSKSPVAAKQQWKKPTSKNGTKNNKRLTEVDKLLMDEGAVNMIYQLTPEAPKGKKNMRTKAEFIKKLQSSTPDGKEMKFRERKKETKSEESEAKKILGAKSSRSSMSGSIKSPSAGEDFETHSADDSIIYRRHSSSSYSSACMSPRRLSDVETGAAQNIRTAQLADNKSQTGPAQKSPETENAAEMFMADTTTSKNSNGINKDDCMSIKEKLNTKLSLALNKKKRESIPKTEKPAKQKRASKTIIAEKVSPVKVENIDKYKQLSLRVEQKLVEICIRKTVPGYNFEMLKELEQALQFVDSKKDVSVTLLTSECGTLCSNLDLRSLLGDNMEIRTNYAHSIAEAVRSLLSTVEKHSKLIVSGVWGPCTGVGLALSALSNICLATDHASFSVSVSPPLPGTAVLTARCSRLSQALINDLVVFGRGLSASEALQGGLVSRCVPGGGAGTGVGADIVRAVAKELASQPAQNILLKKQLLKLNRSEDSMTTFLTGLEKERDLLVEYWTSVEGQDTLREVYSS